MPELAIKRSTAAFDMALPQTLALVARRWKVVYVATPKCACTTLQWRIAEIQGEPMSRIPSSVSPEISRTMVIHDHTMWEKTPSVHSLGPQQRAEISAENGWLIFCVVRHPVSRLWSAWQSKILLREPHYLRWYSRNAWFPPAPSSLAEVAAGFRAFVDALEASPQLRRADPHWIPQADLLHPTEIRYNHVGRVERLPGTLQLLSDHLRANGWDGNFAFRPANESLLTLADVGIEPDTVDRIEQLYQTDMDAFGYQHWEAAGEPSLSGPAVRTVLAAMSALAARSERIADLLTLLANRNPMEVERPN
jgi:hypothetical protein